MGRSSMRWGGRVTLLAVVACLSLGPTAANGDTVATLELDEFSFISFGGQENLRIPAGSTIRFRFGDPAPDGTVSFKIEPTDIRIPELALSGSQGTLRYELFDTAEGMLQTEDESRTMSMSASILATLIRGEESGSLRIPMEFTTGEATATDALEVDSVSLKGQPIVDEARHVQLVGATTNPTNAYPGPGRAVYTVLSGTFDRLP